MFRRGARKRRGGARGGRTGLTAARYRQTASCHPTAAPMGTRLRLRSERDGNRSRRGTGRSTGTRRIARRRRSKALKMSVITRIAITDIARGIPRQSRGGAGRSAGPGGRRSPCRCDPSNDKPIVTRCRQPSFQILSGMGQTAMRIAELSRVSALPHTSLARNGRI